MDNNEIRRSTKVTPSTTVRRGSDLNLDNGIGSENEKNLVLHIEKLPYIILKIESLVLSLIPDWTGVFIHYFLGRYYFGTGKKTEKDEKLKDSSFIRHESERTQSIIQSMRINNPDRVKRALELRGYLNPANIFDFIMFRWLKYLDQDNTTNAVDAKDNLIQVTQNIGLLAALLFTVAFERVTALSENEFELDTIWAYIYIISWVLSSIGFFNATTVSVIFGIIVPELADNDECVRFLEVVDSITLGFASSAHLYNLMVGIAFFFLGTFSMPFVFLSVESGAIVFFSAIPMLTALVIWVLQCVVSLRYSRTLSQITHHWQTEAIGDDDTTSDSNYPLFSCESNSKVNWIEKKYFIRHEDNAIFLQAYIQSTLRDVTENGDYVLIESLPDESSQLKRIDDITGDDFLDFIKGCRLYDDGSIQTGKQLLKQYQNNNEKEKVKEKNKIIVKHEGQRITAFSEHNARLFYTGYIKANNFKFVDVDTYSSDPEKYINNTTQRL